MDLWDDSKLGEPSTLLYNVHAPYQALPNPVVRDLAKKMALPIALMLVNLEGNMNIGMAIRTAAAMGCSQVFVVGKRHYDRRSEVGARNYLTVTRVPEVSDIRRFCEEKGVQPILVEQGGTPLEDFTFPEVRCERPILLILGSESFGIDPLWLKALSDAPRVSISQYGMIRSLNVSMAASIVLYELCRQWRRKTLAKI